MFLCSKLSNQLLSFLCLALRALKHLAQLARLELSRFQAASGVVASLHGSFQLRKLRNSIAEGWNLRDTALGGIQCPPRLVIGSTGSFSSLVSLGFSFGFLLSRGFRIPRRLDERHDARRAASQFYLLLRGIDLRKALVKYLQLLLHPDQFRGPAVAAPDLLEAGPHFS